MADDYGASVNEWVNIVRRAKLDRTTKLVGLTLATYANPDGTKIYPGLARLVVQCRISYSGAKYALRTLRHCELIELVRRGARKRGQSDEYRLVIGPNLLDRLEVPSPDEERADIGAVARKHRSTVNRADREPVDKSADTRDTLARSDTSTAHPLTVETVSTVRNDTVLRSATDPPPSIGPLPIPNPPSIPAGWPGSTAVDRDSARRAGPADAARDLDLAKPNGWKPNRRPWADLQRQYDAGEIDDTDVIKLLGELLDGLDPAEERAAEGMLTNGSHPKAIYNKIRADRRSP